MQHHVKLMLGYGAAIDVKADSLCCRSGCLIINSGGDDFSPSRTFFRLNRKTNKQKNLQNFVCTSGTDFVCLTLNLDKVCLTIAAFFPPLFYITSLCY